MKTFIKLCIILALALTSCSSPESDGENAAKDFCENIDSYVRNKIQAYQNFIKEFDNENYQSRVKAREDLEKKIDEITAEYNSTIQQLEGKYNALLEKHMDDREKIIDLVSAYRSIVDEHSVDTTMFATLRQQANAKILTIIPPDPTIAKIRKDLVGRTIRALPGGYLRDYWSWTIEAGDIKDLQIVEVEKVDTHHTEILVNMTLQAEGAAYKTSGKVYYVLDDRDDWEIDMLEPYEVEVVKTGRYDTSITTSLVKYIMGEWISIHNNSDAALLVGFRIVDSNGKHTKHSLVVGGGETRTYSDLGMVDYSIDFVERP